MLELKSGELTKHHLDSLVSVKAVFQIQRNIDEHMEHVEVGARARYNFAIVTHHFSSEGSSLKFGDHLQKLEFVNTFKVFPFTSNPVRRHGVNFLIKLKSFVNNNVPALVEYFSSLKADLTPIAEAEDVEHEDLVGELCNAVTMARPGAEVMINVMRVKQEDTFKRYSLACLFSFFPVIGSEIWESGNTKSDYWDSVALVQYPSRASFCRMVQSREYSKVFMDKVNGLEDTHTYLTRQIV